MKGKMNKKMVSLILSAMITAACTAGCAEQEMKDDTDVFKQVIVSAPDSSRSDSSQSSETSVTTTVGSWAAELISTPSATTTTAASTATVTSEATTTTPATTTSKTTTKATQTQKTVTKQTDPPKPASGTSPNLAFYKQKLFVIGDSVASGYAAYGRIPVEHSSAKINVSIRTAGGQIDSAKNAKAPLILTSMGMNDWGISSASFAQHYKNFLTRLRAACPGSVILVGAITPTAAVNKYPNVKLSVVKSHNAQLKAIADSMDEKVIYFDAFSAVSSDGEHLDSVYAGADGLHLQPAAYDVLLNSMANLLDSHSMKEKIA
ncbi:SGNH/GDSL hydrolase family protein [Ruminococcus sp. FC2018]|uniref:SGNH/GDSL hydrolase family protein n=1 Tax=Ruminococcus sp. FC2018 TaxID=1410617 RepID=UPI0009DCDB3E|nr:SGNH/GDSL hydrolase family protein [Ruminococcus sp. FC2018]